MKSIKKRRPNLTRISVNLLKNLRSTHLISSKIPNYTKWSSQREKSYNQAKNENVRQQMDKIMILWKLNHNEI